MEPAKRRRFPWVIYVVILCLIGAVALAPVGSVVVAGVIASSHSCALDEGSVHPCLIGGHDYGELLYTLGVLGWLMLITLPAGAVAALLWVVVVAIHYTKWNRRRAIVL